MPAFVPTQEQRKWVASMAGMRMNWDEISSLVINPRTGGPISKETLGKAFAAELTTGKQKLKALVYSKYIKKLEKEDWSAITFGLRRLGDFPDDEQAIGGVRVNTGGDGKQASMIEVRFVKARERADDDEE
jgi:hypothetical protein